VRCPGDPRTNLRRTLAALAARLGTDELRALVLIASRAWLGQARYGRLDVARDRRDFTHEALEEVADALFYIGADLLRRERGRRRAAGSAARSTT